MISLRDLSDDDAERLFQWRNQPDVDRWMCDVAHTDGRAHAAWFDAFRVDPDQCGWIIEAHGRPAGFLTLKGLSGPHGRAEWGWYVGDRASRGRGVGRAAQALGLDHAFGVLGLHKVWAEVLVDNEPALRAQAAAGFRREGYLRAHVRKGETYGDVVLLAIQDREWAAVRGPFLQSLAQSRLIAA